MRPYKLPTGEWIDLDHVLTIGHMWHNCSSSWQYQLCNVTLAFQDKKKEIELASFCDYGIWGKDREKLANKNLKIAKANYKKLLNAWMGK